MPRNFLLGLFFELNHQPLQNLQWIKSFDKQYLQSVAPQLAIAVGLALRGGEE